MILPDFRPVFCAFGSGKLFGYVCYDMIHFYLHHGHPEVHSNMHFRKVYHNHHHFKDYDAGNHLHEKYEASLKMSLSVN